MLPGEKISGLKRISKAVSLMEPTALQAFRTTSRLLGSVCVWDQRQKKEKYRNVKGDYVRQVMSKCVKISSDLNCSFTSNYVHTSIHNNSSPVYFTLVSAEHPPPFDQDHKPLLYDWLTQITQITHHKVISAFQNTFGLINTAPDYGVIGSNPAAKGSQAGNGLFRGGGHYSLLQAED